MVTRRVVDSILMGCETVVCLREGDITERTLAQFDQTIARILLNLVLDLLHSLFGRSLKTP
jgi:hypothetical protein